MRESAGSECSSGKSQATVYWPDEREAPLRSVRGASVES